MEHSHTIRYLRIAATALSLTACVLLVALWVRSFWRSESVALRISGSRLVGAISVKQHIILSYGRFNPMLGVPHRLSLISESITEQWPGMSESQISKTIAHPPFPGFNFRRIRTGGYAAVIPHWCPIIIAATVAAVPWLRWCKRFSLRTLLIATTLVAVGLGLITTVS